MFKNKTIKLSAALILLLIISLTSRFGYAEKNIYYPYPIIFVHGVDANMADTWGNTKGNLEKYFKYGNEYKYFYDDRTDYFPDCDYEFMNNGDIRSIAWVLKASIDNAIKELPEDQKKVIIIAHSMGGLVLRSLLKQLPDYQSKIDRVVFIGTPHLGAPSASALWILKELNKDNDIVTKYSKFYSASAFSGFKFKPINYSPYVFFRVASRLITLKTNIALSLKAAKTFGPDPDGIALEELRLAGDVNYHASIIDFSLFQFIREDISLGHSGNETFLGQNYLSIPLNYKTIRGINYRGGKVLAWGINQLIDNFSNNFTFPVLNEELQSLENAKDIGDGIVTKESQEGIREADYEADYTIDAFHAAEPYAYETILQAIDDKPVIESVCFIMGPQVGGSDYIIVKVKDYLLADIEIVQLTNADLTEFSDPTGKYKPYFRYPDKGYLTERDVTLELSPKKSQKIHLMPGEFHAKLNYRLGPGTIIYIKMKNPAEEEALCQVELVGPSGMSDGVSRYAYRDGDNSAPSCGPLTSPPGLCFQQFRQDAINNFFDNEFYYSYNNLIGGYAHGNVKAAARQYPPECAAYPYYIWEIEAKSMIAPSLKFDLALDKPVKSAALIGTFQFENYKGKGIGEKIIEEKKVTDEGMNFNVSFLNENDNIAFILKTKSRENDDMFEIPIDPRYLNPNGANSWTFSAEFLKEDSLIENCFPNYIEPPIVSVVYDEPLIWSSISYRQDAHVYNPLLAITFKEDTPN